MPGDFFFCARGRRDGGREREGGDAGLKPGGYTIAAKIQRKNRSLGEKRVGMTDAKGRGDAMTCECQRGKNV